ncbi:BatA domain-containing protein [bacterium]|nr:BatA domain-containing protein [bacterium]
MIYLNPALWAGLFLATLPILIHLLGRRRLKRQPFSSLEFLKKLQIKRMRKFRIRQWLLLLLRTLAILALALAFIRPAIDHANAGNQTTTDTVIILDLSASMGARRTEGIPWNSAQEAVREVYQSGTSGSRYAIVVSDKAGNRDIPWHTRDANYQSWLNKLTVDGRNNDLIASWQRVSELMESSVANRKEIVWISDFCDDLPDSLAKLPENVAIIRIPVAEEQPAANATITSVQPADAVIRPDRPFSLRIELEYTGGESPISSIVSVTLDGRRVAEGEVTLTPGRTTAHSFTILQQRTGTFAGEVQVEFEDAMTLDNRYPFILNIPQKRKILISGEHREGIRYFKTALDPKNSTDGYFEVTSHYGELSEADLAKYDAIILPGRSTYRIAEIRRIEEYVRGGGGVWLLMGPNSNPGSYSKELLPQLGLGNITGEHELKRGRRQWEDLNSSHSAISGILESSEHFDVPEVTRSFSIKPTGDSKNLITLSDGGIFLQEVALGEGKIWWTPCAADTSWSDWVLTGIFAPLVQAGTGYLASGNKIMGHEAVCGEPVTWKILSDESTNIREAIDPLENTIPVHAVFLNGERLWLTEESSWPGHYSLLNNGEEVALATAHVARSESNLHVNTKINIGEELRKNSDETISAALSSRRHGREIFFPLLLVAFFALILETFIAREGKPKVENMQPGIENS